MAHRRVNGEGTIYRRKDGRYEAAAYLLTTNGRRKRIRVYAKSHAEAHEKLTEAMATAHAGVPVPDRQTKLADYLDYWLATIVRPNRRPRTYELYEGTVRINLKPGLGQYSLRQLSVPILQAFLDRQLASGYSIRKVQIIRTVLSAALTRASREELIIRNVARLVELPTWERAEVKPWNVDEVKYFLKVARGHQYYPVFVLLALYGFRRGEVLGLRWEDVDFERSVLRVRQQIQRYGGALQAGPVKTKAGRRDLPLLNAARDLLSSIYDLRVPAVSAADGNGLVFVSKTGHPIEPGNLLRAFYLLCAQQGLRRIKIHHLRHTTATLLKNLGVPDRDIQLILGHSQISVTQELYEHGYTEGQRDALTCMEAELFGRPVLARQPVSYVGNVPWSCRRELPPIDSFVAYFTTFLSGGPTGTRTQDTLLKSSNDVGISARATEVRQLLTLCRRQWLLGLLAVNLAVKTEALHTGKPMV